jgi:putative effector of murein hydrolase LrgA (UPF0299 family)
VTTTVSPITAFSYKAALFVFWPIAAAILLMTFTAILVVAWPMTWLVKVKRNEKNRLEITWK